jgi:hypothetical protein
LGVDRFLAVHARAVRAVRKAEERSFDLAAFRDVTVDLRKVEVHEQIRDRLFAGVRDAISQLTVFLIVVLAQFAPDVCPNFIEAPEQALP